MSNRPTIGQIVTVYGMACRIYRIREFGTVDVEAPDGRCFRVSGLPFI